MINDAPIFIIWIEKGGIIKKIGTILNFKFSGFFLWMFLKIVWRSWGRRWRNRIKKSWWWFILRYNTLAWSNDHLFYKKNQRVKIEKINRVYDGPPTMLVHHRHLRLNLTARDLFDQQIKIWRTKTWVLLVMGPKWKFEIN